MVMNLSGISSPLARAVWRYRIILLVKLPWYVICDRTDLQPPKRRYSYSAIQREKEVLLPPNTKFRVMSTFAAGGGLNMIQVVEIPPTDPITTFRDAFSSALVPPSNVVLKSSSSTTSLVGGNTVTPLGGCVQSKQLTDRNAFVGDSVVSNIIERSRENVV
jgi:hypothetical protein